MATLAELSACAHQHLDAYTDPAGHFAFHTYDRLYGFSGRLTALDCFAAKLLSLRLGQEHVIPLFQQGSSHHTALLDSMQRLLDRTDAAASFRNSESIDDEPFRLRDANRCTETVRGWTAVTVSKVLHRLRPNLVPVYDSFLRAFYGTGNTPVRFYTALHADMKANAPLIDKWTKGRYTPDGRPLSDLRAADIVIWHHARSGCTGGA